SRSSMSSRWRSVSTTSIASMSSSSGAGPPVPTGIVSCGFWTTTWFIARATALPYASGRRARRLDGQRAAAVDEPREPLLAGLDALADSGRIARALRAHLVDDLARTFLVVDDGRDELLHGVRANRGTVAGFERRLLDLAADLGQVLETLAHAFLHRVER